ncbi:MAG: BlaI/MecI/CopY family transcriptional regulator [Candidatus Latescibacteria bacterium]|nr:BlaI/MecI/CopY family transcriptional regulator [Candidatus Latescibacterota bacterium]
MKKSKTSTLTKVELEFMQIIWGLGEATTLDIQDALREKGRDLTDGGIRRILSILLKKGHLKRRREGKSFFYSARVEKDQANKTMLLDLLTRAFSDSVSLMVTALLSTRHVSGSELDDIKRLIEEYEKEEKP